MKHRHHRRCPKEALYPLVVISSVLAIFYLIELPNFGGVRTSPDDPNPNNFTRIAGLEQTQDQLHDSPENSSKETPQTEDNSGKIIKEEISPAASSDEEEPPTPLLLSHTPSAEKFLNVTISRMSELLHYSLSFPKPMDRKWSTWADKKLREAKSAIASGGASSYEDDLYPPLYRNISLFVRSYELMENTAKVYIYKEGDHPIFHQPVIQGIYASEGWFMKQLAASKYVTRNPDEAHLFYLPFSSKNLQERLYLPQSHSLDNLVDHLNAYVSKISSKHPFWNRTNGADHFLVACHDWAPKETDPRMSTCIRALCNADMNEGFALGNDVSLPETLVRWPKHLRRGVGGKPPAERSILAFFAGNMHGYLRPKLVERWRNDTEMRIFGKMPKSRRTMNYAQHMKSSRYCICARGYEVNSPRVVEAIYYECVPVIISDNFVPPLFSVLNWEEFAVFVMERDVNDLKVILRSISEERYLRLHMAVKRVQRHFLWQSKPVKYDLFHMILHSIWFNRVLRA